MSLREWTAQLPCTTPASQLGILHGTVAGVPAFRWYDRELGRVLIANRPDDAAIIEQRATTGAGLLCRRRPGLGKPLHRRRPAGDSHHEPARQRPRVRGRPADIRLVPDQPQWLHPRARTDRRRGGEGAVAGRPTEHVSTYCREYTADGPSPVFAPRPTSCNAISTPRSIAEEMRKGTKSIYVDYVDYDEIAHHAGMFRPESLAALDGLDRVLGTLERLADPGCPALPHRGALRPRPVPGPDIPRPVRRRPRRGVHPAYGGGGRLSRRSRGRLGTSGLASPKTSAGTGISGRAAGRAAAASRRHVDQGAEAATLADISVLGSGNLGLLYVHSAVRLTLEDLQERWPKPRSRPVCPRGRRFHCGPRLRRCAVGPRRSTAAFGSTPAR